MSWHLEWHKHSVMTADLMNIHGIAVSRNLEMSNKRRVLKYIMAYPLVTSQRKVKG